MPSDLSKRAATSNCNLVDIEQLNEGVGIVDGKGYFECANTTFAKMLEYSPEDMVGRHLLEFVGDKEMVKQKIADRKKGISDTYTLTMLSKSGSDVNVRVSVSPRLDADGVYSGAIATVTNLKDVNYYKKHIETSFDNTPIGMAHLDLEGRIIKANKFLLNILGYSRKELIGKKLTEVTHPDDRDECIDYKTKIAEGEILPHLTKRHISKAGKTLWANLTLSLVLNAENEPSHLIAIIEDTTKDILAQEKLRQSEEESRLLFEASTIGAATLSSQGIFQRVNKKLCEIFGYEEHELVGMHYNDITFEEDRDLGLDVVKKALRGDIDLIELKKRYVRKDGQIVLCEVSSTVVRSKDGIAIYLLSHIQDISEKEASSRKFLEATERLNTIVETSPEGIVVIQGGLIAYANPFLEKLLKCGKGGLLGRPVQDVLYPEDYNTVYQNYIGRLKGEDVPASYEFRAVAEDGEVIWVKNTGTLISWNDAPAALGFLQERTAQKAAEMERAWNLKLNTAMARLYIPLLSPGATLKESAKSILDESLAITESQYGYVATINEQGALVQSFSDMMKDCVLIKDHDDILFPKKTDGTYPSLWGHSLNTRKPFYTNNPQNHPKYKGIPEGHIFLENFLSAPVLIGDEVVGQIAVANKAGKYDFRDKAAMVNFARYFALAIQKLDFEKALTSSRQLMENILDGIQAGIVIVDPETHTIESINANALRMLNKEEKDVVGQDCSVFCWQNPDGKIVEKCPAKTDMILDWDLLVVRDDQTVLPVVKSVLIEEVDGKEKFVEIFFDVTERKELERRLGLAQKMESLGQMSAGVAHEINTPAQYLNDNLKFLIESFTNISTIAKEYNRCVGKALEKGCEGGPCAKASKLWDDHDIEFYFEETLPALHQSREGVERISSIVKAMKLFAHPGLDTPQPADLNRALETAATVSRNEWKYNSTLTFDLDPHLPFVSCNINELNQAFLNLIVNAAHANTEKYQAVKNQGEIIVRSRLKDAWVEVEISDTGCGMSDSVLARLYDPFFTTKEVGHGTGQGLSLCYSIVVEKHKGSIDFVSSIGEGTVCTIKIPVNREEGHNDH